MSWGRRAAATLTGAAQYATKNEKPAGSLKFIKAASDGPIVESWGHTILWFISHWGGKPDKTGGDYAKFGLGPEWWKANRYRRNKKPAAFPRCTVQGQVARREELQWAGAIVITGVTGAMNYEQNVILQ